MKTVLILGATSDMAQALARVCVAKGWTVQLAARNQEQLAALAGDLRVRSGQEVVQVPFDAENMRMHAAFYAGLPEKPDVVVALFGYMGDQLAVRNDPEELQRTLTVNYAGAVSILGIIANDFEERGSGTIVGVGSVAGDRGRQSNYIYGSAKAGFSTFLSGLRNRLYPSGVHVMTVKPGFCRTKMTESMDLPGALTAEPEQVAQAIVRGIEKRRDVVYTLWMWRWVMLIIRHIPEFIFKRMKL